MAFIARFSANASKSRQATSRKKALDKLNIEDIRPSSRKYPFIHWQAERAPGDQILKVENLGKKLENGEWLFRGINFIMNQDDKIALMDIFRSCNGIFRCTCRYSGTR